VIIILIMQEDDASEFAAMLGGAREYLFKGASLSEMMSVIRAVVDGQFFLTRL
jgi:DNA-binding NarL/FixJ family response regulator